MRSPRSAPRTILRLALISGALGALLIPTTANAQEGHGEEDFVAFEDSSKVASAAHTAAASDLHTTVVVPTRPLSYSTGQAELGAGLVVAGTDTWLLPLSAANGFSERFELGFDVTAVAKPFNYRSMLSNLRIRGKYTFIKDKLVVFGEYRMDGGLLNPTAQHLLVQVPWLVTITPRFRLFTMATAALDYPKYQMTAGSRFILNLTPMFHFTDTIFASLDTQLNFGITPNLKMPISDNRLPVGLGVGYLWSANGAIRAVVTMDDVAPDDGVDRNFAFKLFYVKFIK